MIVFQSSDLNAILQEEYGHIFMIELRQQIQGGSL